MSNPVRGVVKQGVVIPGAPLPEGAQVEISICDPSLEMPPELAAELQAWQYAGADALELVERLAQEGDANEAG